MSICKYAVNGEYICEDTEQFVNQTEFQEAFRHLGGRHMDGNTIGTEKSGVSLHGCADVCLDDADCRGFDYNVKTKSCFIKNINGTEQNTKPGGSEWSHYARKDFDLLGNRRMDGNTLGGTMANVRFSNCITSCKQQPACRGFDYSAPTERCFLKSVTGTMQNTLDGGNEWRHYVKQD